MYGCDPWKDKEDAIERRLDGLENRNIDHDQLLLDLQAEVDNDRAAMQAYASAAVTNDVFNNALITISDEKLDNTYMDEDMHFGPVTITKDGTAVVASFDAINPTTGESTPMSFLLPGATTTDAGVMDASSVAWIADAEERISALEGLSDVKAVAALPDTPTQAQLTTGWVDASGKPPETGDTIQDIDNSMLWVFIAPDWVLYGTKVIVHLATTDTIGGVRDTALTADGNRWYVHVESDGRLALIGGDSLSTLIDTTIPSLQTGLGTIVDTTIPALQSGKQDKLTFDDTPVSGSGNPVKSGGVFNALAAKQASITGGASTITSANLAPSCALVSNGSGKVAFSVVTSTELGYLDGVTSAVQAQLNSKASNTNLTAHTGRTDNPHSVTKSQIGLSNVDNTSDTNKPISTATQIALAGKQAKLTFDSAPTASSTNPITSGGVYSALNALIDPPVIATYEDAIEGIDDTKMMTPLKVWEVITNVVASATPPVDCTEILTMYKGNASITVTPLINAENCTSLESVYEGCSNLATVGYIHCPNAVNMKNMFYGCSSLTSIPPLDTSSVTNMINMFRNCSSLRTIPPLDISRVMNLSYMFMGCSVLTSVTFQCADVRPYGSNMFGSTPIAAGNGYIYVPDNLVDAYKAASGWSNHASIIRGISEKP